MFGKRLHTFALVTTIIALAAYCWLAGTIFEPRICIDSKHLESITLTTPAGSDAPAHTLVLVGRGLCSPRAALSTADASRVEELSSEFSDLERFAEWIKRPFGDWNFKLKIVGEGSQWDTATGEWKISKQLWENPEDRRRTLVQLWLKSPNAELANFLASKIWPGSTQRRGPGVDLSSEAFIEALNGLDRKLWIDSQTVFYRAIVDQSRNSVLDHPVSRTEVTSTAALPAHTIDRKLTKTFETLFASIPDAGFRKQLNENVQDELKQWLERRELRPVVLRYHPLGQTENADRLNETNYDSFRLVDVQSSNLDSAISNLATFHNRLVLQIDAPIPLAELLKLQLFARRVLIVAEGSSSGLLDFYDTYFRLGTQAFASYDHGADFLEISLPALAIAVHNGVDADYRLSAREDFKHPQTVTIARLVDTKAPVVPIEYFRKKTVSATITN